MLRFDLKLNTALKMLLLLSMIVHACNPRTEEPGSGGEDHHEFEVSLAKKSCSLDPNTPVYPHLLGEGSRLKMRPNG